jgi:hypothetical protein
MEHSTLLTVWLSIVIPLAALAAVIIPLTARAKADNMRRLEALMDAHEANLRSGDNEKISESKTRWRTMCRHLQTIPRMEKLGLDLERWGEQAARDIAA